MMKMKMAMKMEMEMYRLTLLPFEDGVSSSTAASPT